MLLFLPNPVCLQSKDHVLSLIGSVEKSGSVVKSSSVLSLNIYDKYLICDILFLGNIASRGGDKKTF